MSTPPFTTLLSYRLFPLGRRARRIAPLGGRSNLPVVVDDGVAPLPLLAKPVFNRTVGQQEKDLGCGLKVEGLLARQKAVVHALGAAVEAKLAHLFFQLPLQLMESLPHFFGAFLPKLEVNGQLVQAIPIEAGLNGVGSFPRLPGNPSSFLLKCEDLNVGLGGRQGHHHVERHLSRPLQEPSRLFAPLAAKGRLEQNRPSRLAGKILQRNNMNKRKENQSEQRPHPRRLTLLKRSRKTARCRGTMLVELSLAVTLLLFVSLWVFRTNMQTIRPRNWAMVQAISDAYMTEHLARAESIDYNELLSATSPWPAFPDSNETSVTIGTLTNGRVFTGELVQTRQPSENNLASGGGTGDVDSNPARVESWIVQSHLTYEVGGRTYVKSRTTVRTR